MFRSVRSSKHPVSILYRSASVLQRSVPFLSLIHISKTKIKTVKSAPQTAVKTKTAKTAKKAADEKAPVSETVVATSEAQAPSAPVEKEMMPEAPQKPQAAAPVKVKRQSFRPNRNAEQQERHEQHGGDVFAQPETVEMCIRDRGIGGYRVVITDFLQGGLFRKDGVFHA